MPVAQREGHVRALIRFVGWDDIEHGQLEHALRMVECHAIGAAPTTIVPGDKELLKAQLAHHLDLVTRHRPFAIWLVIGCRRRLTTITIATQVRCHDRKLPRETWRDFMPHHMRLGMTMQEQQWRTTAAVPHPNPGLTRVEGR